MSQGSTALMLACKRGHEEVVEVLVSRGAEIYMRDCRARSARDTTIRRHHLKLLKYLNTQVVLRSNICIPSSSYLVEILGASAMDFGAFAS